MKNTTEEMASHLEFLGYTIQKPQKKEPKNPQIYAATHAKKWNLVFWEIAPELVMFQVSIAIAKKQTKEMDACVNRANEKLFIAKTYYYLADKKITLRFEAFYTGQYSKSIFGAFIDALLNDVQTFRLQDSQNAFY